MLLRRAGLASLALALLPCSNCIRWAELEAPGEGEGEGDGGEGEGEAAGSLTLEITGDGAILVAVGLSPPQAYRDSGPVTPTPSVGDAVALDFRPAAGSAFVSADTPCGFGTPTCTFEWTGDDEVVSASFGAAGVAATIVAAPGATEVFAVARRTGSGGDATVALAGRAGGAFTVDGETFTCVDQAPLLLELGGPGPSVPYCTGAGATRVLATAGETLYVAGALEGNATLLAGSTGAASFDGGAEPDGFVGRFDRGAVTWLRALGGPNPSAPAHVIISSLAISGDDLFVGGTATGTLDVAGGTPVDGGFVLRFAAVDGTVDSASDLLDVGPGTTVAALTVLDRQPPALVAAGSIDLTLSESVAGIVVATGTDRLAWLLRTDVASGFTNGRAAVLDSSLGVPLIAGLATFASGTRIAAIGSFTGTLGNLFASGTDGFITTTDQDLSVTAQVGLSGPAGQDEVVTHVVTAPDGDLLITAVVGPGAVSIGDTELSGASAGSVQQLIVAKLRGEQLVWSRQLVADGDVNVAGIAADEATARIDLGLSLTGSLSDAGGTAVLDAPGSVRIGGVLTFGE